MAIKSLQEWWQIGGNLVYFSQPNLAPIGWDDPINRFMDFFVLALPLFTT